MNIHFGRPLSGDFEDADAVATAIDQQIIGHYQVYPSNLVAFEQMDKLPEDWATLDESALHRLQAGVQALKTVELHANRTRFENEAERYIARIHACPGRLARPISGHVCQPADQPSLRSSS